VTVDHLDQMKMVSRFTWTNWARGKVIKHDKHLWQGEHDGYKPVTHKRTVMALDGDRWLVVDHLNDAQSHHYSLQWLLNDFPYEQQENSIVLSPDSVKYKVQVGLLDGKSVFSVVRGDPNGTRGWRSQYYGDKEPAVSIRLEVDQPQACFWSYFGFEQDEIEVVEKMLKISSGNWNTKIDLDELKK